MIRSNQKKEKRKEEAKEDKMHQMRDCVKMKIEETSVTWKKVGSVAEIISLITTISMLRSISQVSSKESTTSKDVDLRSIQ